MEGFSYTYPQYFWLFAIIPPMIYWYIRKKKNSQATVRISSVEGFSGAGSNIMRYLRHSLFVIRILVISLLIFILARPQSIKTHNESSEGIDIVITLDISSSMLAMDFEPDRLEASKNIAIEFINKQEYDRIGLVVFSSESFTQCPLTTDHATLINLFNEIKCGIIEDGTAIGHGLATAVNRLKDSDAKSKVVILLTDGVNNQGNIDPITAADLATKYNIRVYTIGVGKEGLAPYPVNSVFGPSVQNVEVKIDEELLKTISKKTDGKYFRATDNESLANIYQEIDKLEKSKIRDKNDSEIVQRYFPFAIAASLLLIIEILLRQTFFKNII
jgi:Ca-activated chloride channel family protein